MSRAGEIIKEGDSVIISGGGARRLFQVKSGFRARMGNSGSADLISLVGMRCGEVVRLDHGTKRFIATNEYPDLDLSGVGDGVDTSKDNRNLLDNNRSQQLSNCDVAAIRRDGGVKELLDQLVENSATFETKTSYAQEKYLRRKKKKYGELFKVEEVTVDGMAEVHVPTIQPTDQDFEDRRNIRLRADTVALILHHCEVHASSRVLMFDRTNGVLPSYVLSRMGKDGMLYQMLEKNGQPNTLHARALKLPLVKERWKAVPNNDSFLRGVEVVVKPEETTGARDEGSSGEVANPRNEGRRPVRLNQEASTGVSQWMKGIDAHRALTEKPADSLVIADDQITVELLAGLLPFVAFGGNIVVFSPYLQDLSLVFAALRQDCVNINITETFYRHYQVLSQRTHPTVNMSTSGGYLLTAVKVNAATRNSAAEGGMARKKQRVE